MNTQDYYNHLHELKAQANSRLQLSMTTFNYVNVAINKTRLATIEQEIRAVGRFMARQEEYIPSPEVLSSPLLTSTQSHTLSEFILLVIEKCVKLECYWLFFSDTEKGAYHYNKIAKVMTQEADIAEYFQGLVDLNEIC